MLRRDICQTLQAEVFRLETAETLHGLIIPNAGLIAALPHVAVYLIHLGHQV